MPVIKRGLPQITSWIWQVRLSYSTLCINCVISLFPFNPSCSVECSALRSEQSLCGRGGRVVCTGAQRAGEPANGNSMKCYKGDCKAHQMGGITPCTSTWWSLSRISAEKVLVEMAVSWQWALAQGRTAAALGGTLPTRGMVLSLCSALVRHTFSAESSPGLLSMRRMGTHQGGPSRGHQDGQGWSTECREKGWAGWPCQPGEGRDSGDPTAIRNEELWRRWSQTLPWVAQK